MEALYRKSLLIRVETARELGSAKASNLMSVDVSAHPAVVLIGRSKRSSPMYKLYMTYGLRF